MRFRTRAPDAATGGRAGATQRGGTGYPAEAGHGDGGGVFLPGESRGVRLVEKIGTPEGTRLGSERAGSRGGGGALPPLPVHFPGLPLKGQLPSPALTRAHFCGPRSPPNCLPPRIPPSSFALGRPVAW